MVQEAVYLRKCKECKRYFLPKKWQEEYCENKSIDFPDMLCKDAYNYRLKIERSKDGRTLIVENFLETLSRNRFVSRSIDNKMYEEYKEKVNYINNTIQDLQEFSDKIDELKNEFKEDKMYGDFNKK